MAWFLNQEIHRETKQNFRMLSGPGKITKSESEACRRTMAQGARFEDPEVLKTCECLEMLQHRSDRLEGPAAAFLKIKRLLIL